MLTKKNKITDPGADREITLLIKQINKIDSSLVVFPDGDTAPSVKDRGPFKTNNTSPAAITDLDDGFPGQRVTIIAGDNNTSIVNGGNFRLTGDWNPSQYDVIDLVSVGTGWVEPR